MTPSAFASSGERRQNISLSPTTPKNRAYEAIHPSFLVTHNVFKYFSFSFP